MSRLEEIILTRTNNALNKINDIDLRDIFAMQAMNGYLSSCSSYASGISPEEISKDAYKLADAMLEARKKK